MAADDRMSLVAVCVTLIMTSFIGASQGTVHELSSSNIEKFLQGKLLTFTFVDSPSCTRCRILFPFFMAASQSFPNDPEIFFTRTLDNSLAQKWEIPDLPAIVYHYVGKKRHEILNADVTVDDIIDKMGRILFGNFGGLTRKYTVSVTQRTYEELIVIPKQHVLILIHDKADDEERDSFEKVAYTFRKDDAIIFATLDVSKYAKLRDEIFVTQETPVVMWFPPEEKYEPRRFGGVMTHEVLTGFVNEVTGLNRHKNGELLPEAGRVPEADKVLEENIVEAMEGTPEERKSVLEAIEALQDKVERQHIEMLDYYLYVLENIAATVQYSLIRPILQQLEKRLTEKEGLGLPTRQQETLKRKRNIVVHFLNLEQKYSRESQTKTKEQKKKERNKPAAVNKVDFHDHQEL